jgi:hypothetical protein
MYNRCERECVKYVHRIVAGGSKAAKMQISEEGETEKITERNPK